MTMVQLVAKISLIGLLAATAAINYGAPQMSRWSYASRTDVPDLGPTRAVPRTARSRDASSTSTGPRVNPVKTSAPAVPVVRGSRYDTLITHHAARSAVSVELVRAVIHVESGFDPAARSDAGAMGLMQLMPETAADLGVVDPYDPEDNVRGGVTYLKHLLHRYRGNEVLALAAYNAGPGTVARYGNRVPPYPETRRYVARVRALARGHQAAAGPVYRRDAIVDGRWTTVYSHVPPSTSG